MDSSSTVVGFIRTQVGVPLQKIYSREGRLLPKVIEALALIFKLLLALILATRIYLCEVITTLLNRELAENESAFSLKVCPSLTGFPLSPHQSSSERIKRYSFYIGQQVGQA